MVEQLLLLRDVGASRGNLSFESLQVPQLASEILQPTSNEDRIGRQNLDVFSPVRQQHPGSVPR